MVFLKGKNTSVLVLLFIMLWLTGCGTKQTENDRLASQTEITVSAAASLTDALQEIKKNYLEEHPEVKINFNLGGSGSLQQQIVQGAPVDLFIPASEKYMNTLVDKGLIDQGEQVSLLSNELTVITHANEGITIQGPGDLLDDEVRKIAIGIPESVPAGKYAKEALEHTGVWEVLLPKMVQAKDVRQVLQYVETRNVETGMVYKTDALSSDEVKIAYTMDFSTYSPIVYPMGIIRTSKHKQGAMDFYNYLRSEEAMNVFVKYGFSGPGV
ncbi:molybdate ABC transporter substrate-binding protein [Paenibacillus dakarensis]|uniref:molybdate ABC transporter substrate-binding protein n=1 Tax=Paenibacillus dakarensis TaxID=1527293 RepID=UPI0006D571D1|nr:molybdate ABC transporter substrate-binding protein [Paenibacillus dakarensis]